MVLNLLSKSINTRKYILGLLTSFIISLGMIIAVFFTVKEYIEKSYLFNINSMIMNNGVDLSLICNVTNCQYLIYDKCLFIPNKNNILEECDYVIGDNIDLIDDILDYFIIRIEPEQELIKNRLEIVSKVELSDTFVNRSLLFIFIMFLYYTYRYIHITVLEYKSDKYDRDLLQSETDNRNKIQLTESIYHDFLGPINVMKVIATHDLDTYNKNTNKDTSKYITTLNSIIKISNNLEEILYSLKRNRNYRVNNNCPSLIDTVNDTVKMFNVGAVTNRVKYNIKCNDTLEDIVLDGMYDGELMNIIQHLLGNSVDAQARHIEITGSVLNKNTVQIIYRDDGTGIVDRNDNMIKPQDYEKLFTEGISTKSELEYKNSTFSYKVILFLNNIFNIGVLSHSTERGIGLYTVKQTLNKHKGTIRIDRSSRNGTVFILTLKVRVVNQK